MGQNAWHRSGVRVPHWLTVAEALRRWPGFAPISTEDENKIIETIELEDTEGVTVLPGVLDLLSSVPSDRWTVVTSATEALARVRLAAAGVPVPREIITADSVSRGKPDPAPYLAGAVLLGFAARIALYLRTRSRAKAGQAAGCTVIATTFSHSMDQLQAAQFW